MGSVRVESQLESALAKAGRVDVLEALLVERDRRIADLEVDRDRWHAAATARRRWWPWRHDADAAMIVDAVQAPRAQVAPCREFVYDIRRRSGGHVGCRGNLGRPRA